MNLDLFIAELPEEQRQQLQEFRLQVQYRINQRAYDMIKTFSKKSGIAATYIYLAVVQAVVELVITLTEAMVSVDFAAASVLKDDIKGRIGKW